MAFFINRYKPVAVTVKCESRVRSFFQHHVRELFGIERTTVFVDVGSVRRSADGLHFRPELAENHRGYFIGGAVGAIKRYLHPLQRKIPRKRIFQEHYVSAERIVNTDILAYARGSGKEMMNVGGKRDFFYFLFSGIRKFHTVAVKDFYSVVHIRVVRGGNDNAGVGIDIFCQESYAGCGHRPHKQDIAPHRRDTGGERTLQHIAGKTGVFSYQDFRPVGFRFLEIVSERASDLHDMKRRHRAFVGHAPYSVSSE